MTFSEECELDEAWKQCLEMWKWIAGQDGEVTTLKEEWMRQTDNYGRIRDNCYFCHYSADDGDECDCYHCPGVLVDPTFNCHYPTYHYEYSPLEFYQKLLELDAIRRGGND